MGLGSKWSPPLTSGESYSEGKVVSSVEGFLDAEQRYENVDLDPFDSKVREYLEGKDTDRVEFVVHPGFWEYGYTNAESNFEDLEAARATGALDREKYIEELKSQLTSSVENSHPVFSLDPGPSSYRNHSTSPESFLENKIGLESSDYYSIEISSSDGTIPFDSQKPFFTIFDEAESFDAVVNGEVNGLCPVQFSSNLASLLHLDFADIGVYKGEQFPLEPVKDEGNMMEAKWVIEQDTDEETSTNAFDKFLQQEIDEL